MACVLVGGRVHVDARHARGVGACSYDGAGLGHMPVLAVRGWARLGRGARLEAHGQVMSSGGNREGRCHAHLELKIGENIEYML